MSTLTQIVLICAVTFVATLAIAGFAPNLKKKKKKKTRLQPQSVEQMINYSDISINIIYFIINEKR